MRLRDGAEEGGRMKHLSLFSGIGGLDLAAEWAGFETVGQCEWADYPTKVLEKHWPDVPRWRDIRTLTKESFYERTGLRTVDIISGGFPCQPFSVAGKRGGQSDNRYLWPEMLRIIQEIGPTWVIGENVAGIIKLALDTVLVDLENIGYACQAIVVPACAVDAPHRRDRIAVLAYTNSKRLQGGQQFGTFNTERETESCGSTCKCGKAMANANANGCARFGISIEKRCDSDEKCFAESKSCGVCVTKIGRSARWPAEPDVGRVANGVPNRVDRLKCLGNAVVPQQFYPIFKAIAEIERGNHVL